ncbi:MMPL family transporter [Nesterenkonia populi]
MARLLYRLGLFAARRAKAVLAFWFAMLVLAGSAFAGFGGQLTDQISMPDLETSEVADRLAEELPDAGGGSATAVVRTEDGSAISEDQRTAVEELIADVESHEVVDEVTDPWETRAELADARDEVEEGRAELDDGQEQLDEAEAELEQAREQLGGMDRDDIDEAQAELDQAWEDAGTTPEEAAEQREEIEAGLAELDAADAELDAQVEQALADGTWPQQEDALNAQRAEIVAERNELEAAQAQLQALEPLEAQQAELDAADEALTEIEEGEAELAEQREELESGDAEAELDQAERQLELNEEFQLLSDHEDVAVLMVGFHDPIERVGTEAIADVSDELTGADIDGLEVLPGGDLSMEMPPIFGVGEAIGLLVAGLVLFIMLGTFVGAGLPLLSAILGVGIGVMAAMSLSGIVEMNNITPILGLMLGLAVGLDYALFIIHRHREQLKDGIDLGESIGLANGTAGNAVVFAGVTNVIALLALNVTGIPMLAMMGSVAAFCVVSAVLLATTIIPAMLKLVGWRILRPRERRYIGAEWKSGGSAESRIGEPIPVGRSLLYAAASIGALAVLALPAMDMRLAFPDAGSEAEDTAAHQAYMATEDAFGQGMNGPLLVVADFPEGLGDMEAGERQLDVADQLGALDHADTVVPLAMNDENTMAAYQVIPEEGPAAESTQDLVYELRDSNPVQDQGVQEVSVAGITAAEIDISDIISDAMPLYLALVIGLCLILMIMVFRSILLPVVATLGFVGSLAASVGIVVAVFQWGWGAELLALGRPGPIMTMLPILMVGILFGLAMDYQLFTASGMREAYAKGVPARLAVRRGLHAGRVVVTACALIMTSVFAGFIFTPDPMVASIGLGLAVGVLLDAFVVRVLLVPAVLTLLGRSAWWIPVWLDRIMPDVDVEGARLVQSEGEDGDAAAASDREKVQA